MSKETKVLADGALGKLIDDGKGGVGVKQKKAVYVKTPKEIGEQVYSKIVASVGSLEGLENLFEKLERGMTKRLNQPIDGTQAQGEQINFKDVYFLIFRKLAGPDSVSILTEEALEVFFNATNEVHLVNTADKNIPINSGAKEMAQEDAMTDDLLSQLLNGD